MNKEQLLAIRRCGTRCATVKQALEACTTSEELSDTLADMGFRHYEYSADAIYVGGDRQHLLAGVVKRFEQWARSDDALGFTDVIDLQMGAIKVTDFTREWVSDTQLLSLETVKRLV